MISSELLVWYGARGANTPHRTLPGKGPQQSVTTDYGTTFASGLTVAAAHDFAYFLNDRVQDKSLKH